METVIVSHNIYLTRDQRYKLHNREVIDVIGINVPVAIKGNSTTEPACEIFTHYKLKNELQFNKNLVKHNKMNYEINLPQNPLYSEVSEALLDIRDKGSESLYFALKQRSKIGNKSFLFVHLVDIKSIEFLNQTLA